MMPPAGNEVIPGALGCAARQKRRLYLKEPEVGQSRSRGLSNSVPELKISQHRRSPQVENSVEQTQFFGWQLFFGGHRDKNRQRVGRGQQLDSGHLHLYLPSFHVRIHGRFRAQDHASSDLDYVLRRQRCREFGSSGFGPFGPERELNKAGSISEVNEQDTPQVSPPMNPTRKPYRAIDLCLDQLATSDVPIFRSAPPGSLDP